MKTARHTGVATHLDQFSSVCAEIALAWRHSSTDERTLVIHGSYKHIQSRLCAPRVNRLQRPTFCKTINNINSLQFILNHAFTYARWLCAWMMYEVSTTRYSMNSANIIETDMLVVVR